MVCRTVVAVRGDGYRGMVLTRRVCQVFLLIVIDGNLDEKSLFFAAIDTAT